MIPADFKTFSRSNETVTLQFEWPWLRNHVKEASDKKLRSPKWNGISCFLQLVEMASPRSQGQEGHCYLKSEPRYSKAQREGIDKIMS